jgi:hypothetical protein
MAARTLLFVDMDEVWLRDGDVLADGFRGAEYINRRAVALIEYKDANWRTNLADPNIEVLSHLATAAGVPAFVVRYSVADLTFEVFGVSTVGREWVREPVVLSEIDFFEFQRSLRRMPPMTVWQRDELAERLARPD